jgi:hypothetical protein
MAARRIDARRGLSRAAVPATSDPYEISVRSGDRGTADRIEIRIIARSG